MALSQDDKDILLEYAQKLELNADALPAFDVPQPNADWYVEYVSDTYHIKHLEHGYVCCAHISTKNRDEF